MKLQLLKKNPDPFISNLNSHSIISFHTRTAVSEWFIDVTAAMCISYSFKLINGSLVGINTFLLYKFSLNSRNCISSPFAKRNARNLLQYQSSNTLTHILRNSCAVRITFHFFFHSIETILSRS